MKICKRMCRLEVSSDTESIVSLLFELARKGQTINTPFIVGETTIQKVHELWGAPERKSENANAIYEEFPSNDVTVGHRSEVIVRYTLQFRRNPTNSSRRYYIYQR